MAQSEQPLYVRSIYNRSGLKSDWVYIRESVRKYDSSLVDMCYWGPLKFVRVGGKIRTYLGSDTSGGLGHRSGIVPVAREGEVLVQVLSVDMCPFKSFFFPLFLSCLSSTLLSRSFRFVLCSKSRVSSSIGFKGHNCMMQKSSGGLHLNQLFLLLLLLIYIGRENK